MPPTDWASSEVVSRRAFFSGRGSEARKSPRRRREPAGYRLPRQRGADAGSASDNGIANAYCAGWGGIIGARGVSRPNHQTATDHKHGPPRTHGAMFDNPAKGGP